MKRLIAGMAVVLGMSSAGVIVRDIGGTETVQAEEIGALPQSLDTQYPPRAKEPRWFLAMLGMGTSFSGVVTDFMESDFSHAEQGYKDFRAQYARVSQMVPEWTDRFPAGPMDALGEALKSRDPAQFMPAVETASKVCHACHVENMTRVQQKYEWDDFGVISVTDPLSKNTVPFRVFMQILDGDLAGVQVDLAQGQVDQARQHATGLAARYGALRESCFACHDSERHYYVDSSITEMIDKLNAGLKTANVDRGNVQELVQGIGMESCHKCHLVHGPAALARYLSTSGKE